MTISIGIDNGLSGGIVAIRDPMILLDWTAASVLKFERERGDG